MRRTVGNRVHKDQVELSESLWSVGGIDSWDIRKVQEGFACKIVGEKEVMVHHNEVEHIPRAGIFYHRAKNMD